MTNCRIDFTGQQGGICVSEPVRISRVQPAAMAPHMSSSAWDNFCDRVDDALKPMDRVKRLMRVGMIVFFVVFIIFMIAPFTWLSVSSSSDPWSQPSMGGAFWAFFVGPLLLIGGMMAMSCIAMQHARSALSAVDAVCEDISKQYSSLSFHVRFEYFVYGRYGGGYNHHNNAYHHGGRHTMTTNYIEVNIADVEATALPSTYIPTTSTFPSPSAPPIVKASMIGGEKSAGDRLRELDEMRGMLSQEEYDQKRKDILDSV